MIRLIFFIVLILNVHLITAQNFITGKIIHAKTNEALPFVHVGIHRTTHGATTDIEGRFQIKTISENDTLTFSYVGFERLLLPIKTINTEFITIELHEKITELDEVVIHGGENPAWRIIRRVLSNKVLNDPENLSSFSYNSYNKLYATLTDNNTKPELAKTDSTKLKRFVENSHLFMIENYTKRYYKKPNQTKEIVLGNRMTGVKDPFFSILATDLQSFSFYTDYIKLFDKLFINPINKGFENRYDFVLEDTRFVGNDSTFIISFEPFQGKNFDGLKGQLHISTDGYAIQYVIAEPQDEHAMISIKIHQQYDKIDRAWFPVQLNTEFYFREFGIRNSPYKFKYISRSYLTNIETNKLIDNKIFGTLNIEFDSNANHRDNSFWEMNRTDSLSRKDLNTYRFYDTLGKKMNALNSIFNVAEALVVEKIKVGAIYLPLADMLRFNNYEGARVGIGIQTGRQLSNFVSFNGFTGYGLYDKALKYGAGIQLNLPVRRETFLRFNWSKDLIEPGTSKLLKSPILGSEVLRNWAAARMDSITTTKIEIALRPIPYSQIVIGLNKELRNPTYRYYYATEISAPDSSFSVTEATVAFRYAKGERYTQIRENKVVTGLDYPQLYLSFSKSFSGLLEGEYNFSKVELRIDQRFRWRGFGNTVISLQGGAALGKIPYSYLFNAKGTRYDGSLNNSIIIPYYFQTMNLYEFVSDKYFYVFFNHNFGRLTSTENKVFRPELSLLQNVGYGKLSTIPRHSGLNFNTLDKGYFESGLVLDNILRLTYAKLVYVGLGGGAFYRHGAYALENKRENLAWKFSMKVSF